MCWFVEGSSFKCPWEYREVVFDIARYFMRVYNLIAEKNESTATGINSTARVSSTFDSIAFYNQFEAFEEKMRGMADTDELLMEVSCNDKFPLTMSSQNFS